MSGRLINEKQLKKKAHAVRTGIEVMDRVGFLSRKPITYRTDQASDINKASSARASFPGQVFLDMSYARVDGNKFSLTNSP